MSQVSAEAASPREVVLLAIDELEQAIPAEPAKLKEHARRATQAIVRAREGWIGLWRAEEDVARRQQLRLGLDRVNGALSLVLGVEYPIAAINPKLLEQARDALQAALVDNLP